MLHVARSGRRDEQGNGGHSKRSKGFSLLGRRFFLFGFPAVERTKLAEQLGRCQAELVGSRPTPTTDTNTTNDIVFVVTNCWTDARPPTELKALRGSKCESVTVFWLHEVLRLQQWISPHMHRFFRPPVRVNDPSAPLLQYPVDYQDAVTAAGNVQPAGDGDDVEMQTPEASEFAYRMRLPCSPAYQLREQMPYWPYIFAYLRRPIRNPTQLEETLQCLHGLDRPLNCLHMALQELLTQDERQTFFEQVLPVMAKLVRQLPFMFPTPPPLLAPWTVDNTAFDQSQRCCIGSKNWTFTKEESLALVCGCFFGIFPDQDIASPDAERQQSSQHRRRPPLVEFPFFTMTRLLHCPNNNSPVPGIKAEKLRCVLEYLLRVVPAFVQDEASIRSQLITFTRVAVFTPPTGGSALGSQADDSAQFVGALTRPGVTDVRAIRCESQRWIEELDAHVQIDFANKYAGGGVFNSGCVQEEIRFLLSPELMVACLIFAKLEPHEAFVIHGTERYSAYKGYGMTFRFNGAFNDSTGFETLERGRRRQCVIVGIDATDYGGSSRVERQFSAEHIQRDLLKAFVGFAYPDAGSANWPVASGNWGCGVFRGDPELKLLIQWLAASLAGRDLVYVLFDRDHELQTKLQRLVAVHETRVGSVSIDWLARLLFNEVASNHSSESVPSWKRHRGGRGHGRGDSHVNVLGAAVAALEAEVRRGEGQDGGLTEQTQPAPVEATGANENSTEAASGKTNLTQTTMDAFFARRP